VSLPFAKPPARIVVERDVIEAVLVEIDHQRKQLRTIIDLMDSGRIKQAREAIDTLLARLS
jgi:hypothetical protein